MGKVQRISSSIDYRKFLKGTIYRSIDKGYVVEKSVENFMDDEFSTSQIRQRRIAEYLLDKLGEPKSWKFYLKCAYHLTEKRIHELLYLALRYGRDPNRYFVYLADKEMRRH